MFDPNHAPFDLRKLIAFLAICQAGSISAAAKRLGQGQATLSEAMAALERHLGAKLFLRGRRGILLTDAGLALQRDGAQLLAQADALQDRIRALASPSGSVEVAMTPSLSLISGVSLVETLNAEHPAIRLHLVEALSGHIIDWLSEGRIDLAYIYDLPDLAGIDLSLVFQEEMFLISAPDFLPAPLRDQGAVAVDDLRDWHFVLPSAKQPARGSLDAQLRQLGLRLRQISDLDSHSQIVEMLARASACTILPKAPVLKELANGSLIATPIAGARLHRTCYAARPRARAVTSASIEVERTMAAILREASHRHGLDLRFG